MFIVFLNFMESLNMKYFSSLIFFGFLSIASSSQNYQCVNSGSIYFLKKFQYNYPFINSIRVDSVAIAGSDSVLFPYKQVGIDYNYCLDTSWAGERIIVRPSGENVFYSGNDSVKILATAFLNQSWKLYSFSNGNYLEATLFEIASQTFLGINDTVKKIRLTSKDAGGNNITHPFNNKEIWLSKNFGLIKWYDVRNFPDDTSDYSLIGNSNPAVGLQNFGAKEIFDFNAGDVFDYYTSQAYPFFASNYSYERRIILEKNFSADTSSVTYSIDQTSFGTSNNGYPDFVADTSYYHDTISLTYDFTDYSYLRKLPFEMIASPYDDFSRTTDWIDSFTYDQPYYAKTFPNFYFYSLNDSCMMEVTGTGIYHDISYVLGLGQVLDYEYEDPMVNYSNSLVYFKKGNVEWGTPINFSNLLSTEDLSPQESVKIYPNPAQGFIQIGLPDNSNPYLQIEVRNEIGIVISEAEVNHQQNGFKLNIQKLERGIYFLRILDDNQTYFGKFLKN